MNTLIEEAKGFYAKLGNPLWFEKDLGNYLLDGYIHSTPTSLILGKPARRDGGDPVDQWRVDEPDAWFVQFAVGDGSISHFINLMPFQLPYVGWARELKKRPVKWWATETILRRK